ncbi:transcription termination/antitermination protein NusG [archaeon]|nr:transcription termination/antitermination protein NusG [archaeon]NCQ50425.1 transcription termination/antitermination protein NusG [archaeon]
MSWYTLQTSPNRESKVTLAMEEKIANGLPIREIFAPIETIYELKDGKKKERQKRMLTNYIFVEMDYTDQIWHALKGISGVVGFIGRKGNPATVSEKEIQVLKDKVNGEAPKPKISFEVGTIVRIKEGSFLDFNGVVRSVDYSKNKAKVAINIFNRETEAEIDLEFIEMV